MTAVFAWCSKSLRAIPAAGALAGLMLIASGGPALSVLAGPETQTCNGKCEACIEMEHTDKGDRCVKCGVDPKCLGNTGDPGLTSDFTTAVNQHNSYRGQQCAAALTWSADLAAGAQTWANACTKAHSADAFNGGYGENLYWGSGNLGDADDAVKWWHDEIKKYNFQDPVWSNDVGHFTQLVWKGSKQIGCGVARCGNENYWVCRYSPAGNLNVSTKYVSAEEAKKNLIANVGCAQPAVNGGGGGGGGGGNAPAPGGKTAEVIAAVDVYAAPGGQGNSLGTLDAGKTVTLLSACVDNWCHVAGNDVPGGKGWVYNNASDPNDFQSLKF
jgi:uncharacterized protein YkwD